jgi:hypothetical protein
MVYVEMVMNRSVIYQFLALDLEPWVLWDGKEDTRGGNCIIA